jgi:hypothetical protein
MFGISSFSEAPFSGIVDTRDAGWQEIRNNVDAWVTKSTDSSFLVRASNGVDYQCSLTVLSSSAVGYVVSLEILDSSGTGFICSSNLWQDSSTSSNVWV